jgi:hypothetical protein
MQIAIQEMNEAILPDNQRNIDNLALWNQIKPMADACGLHFVAIEMSRHEATGCREWHVHSLDNC